MTLSDHIIFDNMEHVFLKKFISIIWAIDDSSLGWWSVREQRRAAGMSDDRLGELDQVKDSENFDSKKCLNFMISANRPKLGSIINPMAKYLQKNEGFDEMELYLQEEEMKGEMK